MADRSLRIARFPRGAVLPLVAALIWSMASSAGILSGPMAVSPLEVVATPFVDRSGRELWMALITSIARVLSGGILGGLIGLVLGYVAGMYRTAALGLAPTVHTIRQVALFAWIPLLTAWFGNGESTKLVFTALSTFFPLFLATEQGVRQAPLPRSKRRIRSASDHGPGFASFTSPPRCPASMLGCKSPSSLRGSEPAVPSMQSGMAAGWAATSQALAISSGWTSSSLASLRSLRAASHSLPQFGSQPPQYHHGARKPDERPCA